MAEFQRILLPDAPPRKRRSLKLSPEREPCELLPAPAPSTSESLSPKKFISVKSTTEINSCVPPAPVSGATSSSDHPSLENIQLVQPHSPAQNVEQPEVEIEYINLQDQPEVKTEYISFQDPLHLRTMLMPVVNDNGQTIEDGSFLNDSEGEDDMDVDGEGNDLTLVSECKASAEPASEIDMSPIEQEVLTSEDRRNDAVIRKIAPNCSFDFNWTSDRRTFLGKREIFTQTTGPTFRVTKETSPVDIFYKMFDSDFIDSLCTETNRYATQQIKLLKQQKKLLSNSRLRRWQPTDRDEMISFLVLTILQGLYPLVEEESYFSFNGFGTMPYFRKIMSYNRYLLLRSMFHFVDNSTITETDRLFKIKPVTEYFNKKFSSLYNLSQEIVIDESLLKWHGRLAFSQKIQTKAAHVGIKTYELCESSTGYLWKFFVYAGKNKVHDNVTKIVDMNDEPTTSNTVTQQPATDSKDNRPSATAKIVYSLIEPLLYRGHTLIMDNFYNCPLLARCLKSQKTDCYGTLRLNREFVPNSFKTMTKTDLRQGEVVASYCSDLSVMVWRDANLVSMISTYHHLQVGTSQKHERLKYKPKVVLDYNKSMGGVDRKDQYLSAQPIERVKCQVWYKKLFRRLFNAALFNCFIIYHTAHPTITHRKFRTVLAEGLLKLHKNIDLTAEPRLLTLKGKQSTTARPGTASRPKLEHRHFPIKTGFKQSRCWLCAQRKVTARTVWKCMECNVNLCIANCFMQYHI